MSMKIWFITGISSGLGKALAQSVMENGDFVIGTLRKTEEVEAFNKDHSEKGKGILLDVTDFDSVKRVVQQIVSDHGRIDVLVNNAGIGFVGSVEETSLSEARHVMETNFYSALMLTQAVLPIMRKEESGTIVQISSHGGVKAFAGFGIYNASKFALEGFSEALAQEVAPLGIKILIVEPGPFRTSFAGNNLKQSEKVIYDYADTAGAFKSKLRSVDGLQEGDPVKAAMAIMDHIASGNSTLRMPLGKVALQTIGAKIQSLTNDLEANRALAESVVY